MRKIDVNCMIGNSVSQEYAINTEQQFLEALDYFRIDQAIAYHATARRMNPIIGNERLLALARTSDQIIPCFILSPHYKYDMGWNALELLLQEQQIKFAKIFPKEQGFTLHGSHTRELFDIAARNNIHMLIDQSEIVDASGTELECFEALLRNYPTVTVILTSIRHRRKMVMYSYFEQYPNFYTEFSVYDNWLAYEEAVRLFGSHNLLWGSNMPINMPGAAITMLTYAQIDSNDKENIAFRNANRLIGGELPCS
ncbi:amidohydrolase family protein [Paenibacillus sp. GYB004]|uniref:amidohydrolase family protein n=1 Tax=unclassified Paenibacillus TaxID=185978 RepID=UPI002F967754